jgi:hypothetical protein
MTIVSWTGYAASNDEQEWTWKEAVLFSVQFKDDIVNIKNQSVYIHLTDIIAIFLFVCILKVVFSTGLRNINLTHSQTYAV